LLNILFNCKRNKIKKRKFYFIFLNKDIKLE
jgi:hypothetical protein